jgi:hypothetical protein
LRHQVLHRVLLLQDLQEPDDLVVRPVRVPVPLVVEPVRVSLGHGREEDGVVFEKAHFEVASKLAVNTKQEARNRTHCDRGSFTLLSTLYFTPASVFQNSVFISAERACFFRRKIRCAGAPNSWPWSPLPLELARARQCLIRLEAEHRQAGSTNPA